MVSDLCLIWLALEMVLLKRSQGLHKIWGSKISLLKYKNANPNVTVISGKCSAQRLPGLHINKGLDRDNTFYSEACPSMFTQFLRVAQVRSFHLVVNPSRR
ncbi:hypothetical protein CEXT_113651 [Caerostris extrusa]|uniref:Ribosomal protein/NADH dehydrogenase domain-containing protein n=1 Tax=Caerostris extrusa TaxID=172846 RepID=A0AAV4N2F8_CAEEX|nr:hypothetical protein CEXT_113651 [Caerostris extrusa]